MTTPFQLNNKTILITGASSGLGKQIAISCSKMGAKVVITGRNTERLNETFSLLQGEGHLQFVCDLMDEAKRNEFIDLCSTLDGFVHSAGIVVPVPVKFIAEKHIRQAFGINFESALLMVTQLLKNKKLNNGASLIFFSSVSVNHPYSGGSLYSASKAAIEAYSKNLALEVSSRKIRSNCIKPAMVSTPLYEETKSQVMYQDTAEYEKKYPLGIGTPDDIANAAIYLLSDASRWVTGTDLLIDGGFTIGSK
ncbi:MAG TPA: SDR family oxidoreductase [Bacteroidia bacterium]|nr:SDR family oxidoreductase [Bacteroidia bacterium]